jgi:hypothetical protein
METKAQILDGVKKLILSVRQDAVYAKMTMKYLGLDKRSKAALIKIRERFKELKKLGIGGE